MQRATELFDAPQRKRVEAAVAAAEGQTSCEVVPVVATASGRYDRAEDLVGLWLAVGAAVGCWMMLPRPTHVSGDWSQASSIWSLLALVTAMVVAFVLGATAASRIGWLRRLFTPRVEMLEEVTYNARATFFDKRVHHTESGSGLLVFISLYERMAVVLGDERVLETVGQTVLDELCVDLTQRLRTSGPAEALPEFLGEVGRTLAKDLPASETPADELSNTLILIDEISGRGQNQYG